MTGAYIIHYLFIYLDYIITYGCVHNIIRDRIAEIYFYCARPCVLTIPTRTICRYIYHIPYIPIYGCMINAVFGQRVAG